MRKYSTRYTDWGIHLGGLLGGVAAAVGCVLLAESWTPHGAMAMRVLIIAGLIGVLTGAVIGGVAGGIIDSLLDRRRRNE